MPLHQRAVVTYDFESLSIHLYDGQAHSTIPLTPQQCILLAQQLLTNALLCQHHTAAAGSASTVTTPSSQAPVTTEATAVPVAEGVSKRSA